MYTRVLGIALSGLVALGAACVASAGARTHHIQAREARQERRISNGVKSGKLNARQEQRLDRRETRVTTEANFP